MEETFNCREYGRALFPRRVFSSASRLCLLLLMAVCVCVAQTAVIRFEGGLFRVAGWPASHEPDGGWPSLFAVYAGEGEVPPLLGSYSVEGGELTFQPRFPISPGMRVRAVFRPPTGSRVDATFDTAKAAPLASTTRVTHVYPSSGMLPENQLKMYVYFSAPMSRGQAWERIHLLDENGAPIELAFLEIDQELWDPAATRLTVLFDPGRIKRGLVPIREMGPSIVEGKRYTLLIDREWKDGRGAPLAESYRKEFRVGPADRTPPLHTNWRVSPPRSGTSDPLTLVFPEPLDYALLQHMIDVRGPAGPVSGSVAVDHGETEWRFTPTQSWKPGEYRLVIQTALEDLAGNHIGRPFDVDVFDRVSRNIARETVSLSFRVRP